MLAVAIDTLRYSKKLQAAGVSPQQADAQAEALSEAVRDAIATKSDVSDLRNELKHDIAELRAEMKHEIAELRAEVKHDIAELRAEMKQEIALLRTEIKDIQVTMLKWIIPLMLAQAAAVVSLVHMH